MALYSLCMERNFMKKDFFDEAMDYIFDVEGGYVNHPNDPGGATNMGITQSSYNDYRKRKNLPKKDVKSLTKEEAKKIYYEDYWLPVVKPEMTKKMALAAFDGEINLGNSVNSKLLKKSGGNVEKYLELRLENYSNDKNQASFGEGWNNRIKKLKNTIDGFDFDDYLDTDPVTRVTGKNLLKQLQQETDEKIKRYHDIIYQSMLKSASKNSSENSKAKLTGEMLKNQLDKQNEYKDNFLKKIYMESEGIQKRFNGKIPEGYKNPYLENDKIFTKEEVEAMSKSDRKANEKAINYQKKVIGMPTEKEAAKAASKEGSGLVHVSGYTTSDGRKVGDYYRARPQR